MRIKLYRIKIPKKVYVDKGLKNPRQLIDSNQPTFVINFEKEIVTFSDNL